MLTRKFSSDSVKTFGFLRRMVGSNDNLDVASVISGLERMLKTGIVASSINNNVNAATSFCRESALSPCRAAKADNPGAAEVFFPASAERLLLELCVEPPPRLSGPEVATVAMIGGFLVRAATEKWNCRSCVDLIEKPKCDAPVDALIKHQDRGGLKYPTSELVRVLLALKAFVEIVLRNRRAIAKPLTTSVQRALRVLMGCPCFDVRRGSTSPEDVPGTCMQEVHKAPFDQPRCEHYGQKCRGENARKQAPLSQNAETVNF